MQKSRTAMNFQRTLNRRFISFLLILMHHPDSKYIIHTVGPVYDPNDEDTMANQLASCYYASLRLAVRNHVRSIVRL